MTINYSNENNQTNSQINKKSIDRCGYGTRYSKCRELNSSKREKCSFSHAQMYSKKAH
jgi:hypothetical protein